MHLLFCLSHSLAIWCYSLQASSVMHRESFRWCKRLPHTFAHFLPLLLEAPLPFPLLPSSESTLLANILTLSVVTGCSFNWLLHSLYYTFSWNRSDSRWFSTVKEARECLMNAFRRTICEPVSMSSANSSSSTWQITHFYPSHFRRQTQSCIFLSFAGRCIANWWTSTVASVCTQNVPICALPVCIVYADEEVIKNDRWIKITSKKWR